MGVQELEADDFAIQREVRSESWLGLRHQGRGVSQGRLAFEQAVPADPPGMGRAGRAVRGTVGGDAMRPRPR
ncbi:hypothetical protein DY240_30075 [Jiangella rhizosphaerae]|uniref:Uncharacterized protein n=1 Tax=Jiangella rhizosphaerae TaxID=2293569 RepID=A0A418KGF2_9ACTN|nr:hypothetical protein DY240_30075 [Jiangella rhizosphaerae]